VIRIGKAGKLIIHDIEMSGWFLEGDGERLTGDINDFDTPACKILVAAALIHDAGYAGFALIKHVDDGTEMDAARQALQAIDAARAQQGGQP
jgi:hypothetical protein